MAQFWKKAILLTCAGVFCSIGSAQALPYAQLSSTFDQTLTGTPQPVIIDSIDEIHKISVSESEITIKKDGLYLIILAGQVGTKALSFPPLVTPYLDLWLVKNGENVSNSNTRQSVQSIVGTNIFPFSTGVLVSQTVTKLKKGDVLQAYINGTPGVALVVSPGTPSGDLPTGEPRSPSIIISITKLK